MKTVRAQLAQGYAWWEHQLTNMEGAQEPVASSGISFHLWRLYQHFWLLVCLLFPIVSLVQTPPAPVRLLLAALALVFFATSYTWLMWPHPASSGARIRAQSRTSLILFAVLIRWPCRNWAHAIGWKRHTSLNRGDGCEREIVQEIASQQNYPQSSS
jgi:hypothetical protein